VKVSSLQWPGASGGVYKEYSHFSRRSDGDSVNKKVFEKGQCCPIMRIRINWGGKQTDDAVEPLRSNLRD
jgi:hypothetical protein